METFILRLRLLALAARRLVTLLQVLMTERVAGDASGMDAVEMWTDAPLVWIVPCPGAVYRGADLGPVVPGIRGVRRYLYETQSGCKQTILAWPDADLVVPRKSDHREKVT